MAINVKTGGKPAYTVVDENRRVPLPDPTAEKFILDLINFSEWLDSEGIIVGDQGPDADKRTHEELARQFVAQR